MLPVGDIIRTLRSERNLTQDQLAQKIGVDRSTISTYESENRLPSLFSLIELSRVFGVTTDYLLGVTKEQTTFLDVSGLTPEQINSLNMIIENYREGNAASAEAPKT